MPILDTVPVPRPSGPHSPSARANGRWYIEVAVRDPEKPYAHPTRYLLGPTSKQGGWSRALEIARSWEKEFGAGTARLQFRDPSDLRFVDKRRP